MKISKLPAAAPGATSLLEISVPDASSPSGYVSRRCTVADLLAALGLDLTPDGLLYVTEADTIADTLGTPPNGAALFTNSAAGIFAVPGYSISNTSGGSTYTLNFCINGAEGAGFIEVDANGPGPWTTGNCPANSFITGRGTPSEPAPLQTGDVIFNIYGAGFCAAATYSYVWQNYAVAEEDFDATHGAGSYHIGTVDVVGETIGAPIDRIIVDKDGNTNIVNGAFSAGNGAMNVDQNGNLESTMLFSNNGNYLIGALGSLASGAGASVGTLTDAPSAGNPTKWIPIYDNGVTRYIPAW